MWICIDGRHPLPVLATRSESGRTRRHHSRLCHRSLSCFQDSGPGRSTRWARVLEFHDQRPILIPHDDNPFLVKWNRNGPNLLIFRNMMAMRRSLPRFDRRQTSVRLGRAFPGYPGNMTANGIVSAILIGVLVGTLGRLILPGRQNIGVVSTVAIGILAALGGTWIARELNIDERAPASFNWDAVGWHATWSWAELGVQVLVAIVVIALATALTNTSIAHRDGQPRTKRRRRSRAG
jgi:uncharacterized membrane protein YeaQ/YmgE (transglycosylase-associated protein family)